MPLAGLCVDRTHGVIILESSSPSRTPNLRSNDMQVEKYMDKDRTQGSIEQAKGKVKEIAGKVTGDVKLEAEGKTQQTVGKIQNAVGGFKDAIKDAVKK